MKEGCFLYKIQMLQHLTEQSHLVATVICELPDWVYKFADNR